MQGGLAPADPHTQGTSSHVPAQAGAEAQAHSPVDPQLTLTEETRALEAGQLLLAQEQHHLAQAAAKGHKQRSKKQKQKAKQQQQQQNWQGNMSGQAASQPVTCSEAAGQTPMLEAGNGHNAAHGLAGTPSTSASGSGMADHRLHGLLFCPITKVKNKRRLCCCCKHLLHIP